ncbi:MAG: branched-chain amino acid ABC transporter permease [Vulcanimicrobiaceae bacterium]
MSYALTVAAFGLLYAMLALGLNLQMGYTGIVNFGYVAFVAIGAYTSAILTTSYGWSCPLAWAVATLLSAAASYPLGVLTIRLGGDYLAVVTLGFSQLIVLFILNERGLTKGSVGISGIARPFAQLGYGAAQALTLLIIVLAVFASAWMMWRLAHSPLGRLLRAIQANEAAAQALGKNTTGYKILVLVIGSGIAGFAGALYASWVQYISPEQFSPDVTFNTFIALILGGVGSILGPIIGAFVLIVFLQGTIVLPDYLPMISATQIAAMRFMLIGLLLIVLVLFRPNGLMGTIAMRRKKAEMARKAEAPTT